MVTLSVVLSLQPPALLTKSCTKVTWVMLVVLAVPVKKMVLSLLVVVEVTRVQWAGLHAQLNGLQGSAFPLHRVMLFAVATGLG